MDFTITGGAVIAIGGIFPALAIGIIGEYLGRVHMKAIGKPAYIVRTVTDPVEDR